MFPTMMRDFVALQELEKKGMFNFLAEIWRRLLGSR